ncbi:MAG: prolipoprotein diacylglyceryl transferase [Balneola sp.]|jgi:hypothetical protein|nr:prolipoprotein diacylglyceryl transferase [Balneola sp.]MBE77889.1 prolipoprotein diacylglyceryl transferase [Balneola sp.]HBX66800.1 prolipoprotein diacylglyceryl transferase [Balneolaceae bacterium]|tara:strand:+ start:196 stop:507 length:312 start_codon:yes stop_codon:yes gene_type:complete
MQILQKLKERWGISSNMQVFVILIVFSCTGFTALYARRFIFDLLGIAENDPFWFKAIVWLVTILPLYNIVLLIYGALFGQWDFFWGFFKKMISRLKPQESKEG